MKKKAFLTILPLIVFSAAYVPLTLTSCSAGIVFANYESYMAPSVMKHLKQQNGSVQFVSYTTNEDIMAKFERSYDIAVPSVYTVLELIKEGLLDKIEWGVFNVSSPINGERYDTPDLIQNAYPDGYNNDSDYVPREDPTNAQSLFSDTTDNIIDAVDIWAHSNYYYGEQVSILDYALPYFLQDMLFAYHGEEIDNLSSSSSWNDITDTISYKNNPDARFVNTSRPKMTMVDDGRSIYDISHLVYNQEGNVPDEDQNVNPDGNEKKPEDYEKVYAYLTNKFKQNSFYLNTDSQQVLASFAHPTSNGYANTNAIISYSGDVSYATMGAGESKWENAWDDSNTHIIKPANTPIVMDMVVVNKRSNNKQQQIYDLLKTSILDNCEKPVDAIETMYKNHEFNGPMSNFDFEQYTPTLWNIQRYVNNYSQDYYDWLYQNEPDKASLLRDINNITFSSDSTNLIELPLDNLAKSNMSIAWMKQKELL